MTIEPVFHHFTADYGHSLATDDPSHSLLKHNHFRPCNTIKERGHLSAHYKVLSKILYHILSTFVLFPEESSELKCFTRTQF